MSKKNASTVVESNEPVLAEPKESFDFLFNLVVLNPFMHYRKGDQINAPADIQAVIDKGFLRNCLKTLRNH